MHQTTNVDDAYLGSGTLLRQAIKKYGRENFTREILFLCDTPQEMRQKEKELVEKLVAEDIKCYNISPGGAGGPFFKGKTHTEEVRKQISLAGKARDPISEETRAKFKLRTQSPEIREKIAQTKRGRKLSEETKKKISDSLKRTNKEKQIVAGC